MSDSELARAEEEYKRAATRYIQMLERLDKHDDRRRRLKGMLAIAEETAVALPLSDIEAIREIQRQFSEGGRSSAYTFHPTLVVRDAKRLQKIKLPPAPCFDAKASPLTRQMLVDLINAQTPGEHPDPNCANCHGHGTYPTGVEGHGQQEMAECECAGPGT